MISKLPLMVFIWLFALCLSSGLRFWGVLHPDPFIIRPLFLWGLLFGPSILLVFYLIFVDLRKSEL